MSCQQSDTRVCAKNSGVVKGQVLQVASQVARSKRIVKGRFKVEKTFWGDIKGFLPLLHSSRIRAMLLCGNCKIDR